MQTCRFVKDDRKPDLGATLKYDDGGAVNLVGCTVTFHMRQYLGRAYSPAYKVRAAAAVTSAAGGRVKYEWAAGDLDTVGEFHGEFEVTWPDGKPQTTDLFAVMVREEMA